MPERLVAKILLVVVLILTFSASSEAALQIGVVLGGGAARGFSHIGLIQALEENGVPIDLLVGTSMGSIVSSLYAAGYSVDNMRQILTTLDTAALVDLTIPPKGGFINPTRLQHYLDTLLNHKTFDQLDIPFYSVITNVRTGEEVALNEGLVSVGVQASISIPALFPPVLIGGHYYVDGGMKNAVPVNVAKDQGADVIIAVDVKKDLEKIDHDNVLTNIQLSMWFMIDGYVQSNIGMADVVIVPEVKYDSYMDYQKIEFFIEEGYLAGLAHMDQIKAAILAQDPSFQFAPYTQEGFSSCEIDSIAERAMARAINLPQPLRIAPEVTFDPLGEFAQIGFKVGHGPLSWFNLGYRYGLNNMNGGHEAFLEWSKEHLGHFGAFIRKSPNLPTTTWGAEFALPVTEKLDMAGVYLSQGATEWQLSSSYRKLLDFDHTSLDLEAKLTKMRPPAIPLLATLSPIVKLFPFDKSHSALEVALIRPYGYGGVELTTPIEEWNSQLSFELGLGSELKVFGLYPIEASMGYRVGGDSDNSWIFMIKGGSF